VVGVAVEDLASYERLWIERLTTLPKTARVSSPLTMQVLQRST